MPRSSAKHSVSFFLVLMTAISVWAQQQPPPTKSEAVFKQLTSLVGEWEAGQDGVPVSETYTLTANGSALMAETKPRNEPAMITMFTVDGDRLVATHYCAARNQPQMETGVPEDLKEGVTFSLVRVAGMKTPDDWHNTGLTITLEDEDHMSQRWTYLYKGKSGTNVFHYTRKHLSARDAMIQVLGSPNPNPSMGDEAQTFDRLVGSWDADFGFHRDDGTVFHKKGELHFGWVMDGRAIQDLWILYPTGDQKERTIGTTIRFFDTKLKQWRIVFINPQFNYVITTQGGREGDRIVLRGIDSDGLPIRWTFSEITPQTFHWQGERSHDGGKTWKIEEDHHMSRRSG